MSEGNSVTYAYDDLSRRTTVTLGNATTTTYAYTTQSALLTLTQNLAGTAQDNTWTYGRNQAQEITSHAWSNDAYQWTGYVNGTKVYTANGLNQYTAAAGAALGYDGNGNLSSYSTWTYGYDADNRLRTASRPGLAATLAYDGNGRMHRTTIAGVTTHLLYDGTDLVAEYDGSNALLRRYVHGPGIDEPLVWYEGSGTGSKTWLYADHQGSIAATANSTGVSTATYAYSPYGETNGTAGVRFRYTGQQLLGPLGLYYYKARIYWPALGRFQQTDPVGYGSDMNLYAYVGNDPVNLTDPTGAIGFNLGAAGIGAIIGGASSGITAYGNGENLSGVASAAFIGAISGAFTGLALRPLGTIATGAAANAAGNLAGQTFSSGGSVDFGKVGVAAGLGAVGGAGAVAARAGGFGPAAQATFGGAVVVVPQGLIDLRAAANKDFAVTGVPSNSAGNISASSSGRAPAGGVSCVKRCN